MNNFEAVSITRLNGHSRVKVLRDVDDATLEDIKRLCEAIDEQTEAKRQAVRP